MSVLGISVFLAANFSKTMTLHIYFLYLCAVLWADDNKLRCSGVRGVKNVSKNLNVLKTIRDTSNSKNKD